MTFHLGARRADARTAASTPVRPATRGSRPTLGIELAGAGARESKRAPTCFRSTSSPARRSRCRNSACGRRPARREPGIASSTSATTVARADTLRVGFALDAARRLTFVLAADGVMLGAHHYPTLDLTSPDAVMDAVGNTVSDVAAQLLAGCGDALTVVRLLLGLDAPAGVDGRHAAGVDDRSGRRPSVATGEDLIQRATGRAVTTVLAPSATRWRMRAERRRRVKGTGTQDDPWRVPLIGPLELEAFRRRHRCSRLASRPRRHRRHARSAVHGGHDAVRRDARRNRPRGEDGQALLPAVEGLLSARERGVNPPRILLPFGDGVALTASGVGLRLGWSPTRRARR